MSGMNQHIKQIILLVGYLELQNKIVNVMPYIGRIDRVTILNRMIFQVSLMVTLQHLITLRSTIQDLLSLLVSVAGVIQEPEVAYQIDSNEIVFGLGTALLVDFSVLRCRNQSISIQFLMEL